MKVSELTGEQLNKWVAKAEGYEHHGAVGVFERNDSRPWCLSEVNDWWKDPEGRWICGPCTGFPHNYSTEWAQGGPIIERDRIGVWPTDYFVGHKSPPDGPTDNYGAEVRTSGSGFLQFGQTPLIAAMRAKVASKYGDEVPDDPKEREGK